MRPDDIVRARRRMRRGPRALAALIVLAVVAVFVAGCGGGSSLGVDSLSGSRTSGGHGSSSRSVGRGPRFVGYAPTPAQRASSEVAGLLFSRCMRSHGVPNFPDPSPNGGFGLGGGSAGFDYAAPLFRRAQRTCVSSFVSRQRAVSG